MTRSSTPSTTAPFASVARLAGNPWVRGLLLTLYYLAILTGLVLLYGRGDFSTPGFVYQGF